MSVRRVLARNTAFNAAGRLWEAASTLVLTRYILDRVAAEGYGLWGLVAVFTGYVALLDVGLGSAYVKYIAEHAARDERDALSSVVSTGFFFYLLLGALLVAIGWPCMDLVVQAFQAFGVLNEGNVAQARFLFRGALVLFATTNVMGAFTSVLTGLQRMGLTNLMSFVASLVKIAATVLFLEKGFGLPGLLYANALAFAVFALGCTVLAFRLVPALRLSLGRVRRNTFGKLFGFGWRAQVARLANLVMFETDMVVAGAISGQLGLAGLYKLGVDLANKMRQVPVLLVSAIVPAASDLDAREEHARLADLYVRSTKYVACVAVPLVLFTVGSADLLIRTWLGPGHQVSAWVLRIIAFGYIANIMPGAGVSVVLGKGRADLQMKAGVIATVANIVLTVALALTVGFWGIPVATAISMFISWTWFARALAPVIGVSPGRMLRAAMVWPAAAALPGFVCCVVLDWSTREAAALEGFAPSAGVLVAATAVYGVLFLSLIRIAPFLDAFDAAFLGETLGLARVPLVRRWLRGACRV